MQVNLVYVCGLPLFIPVEEHADRSCVLKVSLFLKVSFFILVWFMLATLLYCRFSGNSILVLLLRRSAFPGRLPAHIIHWMDPGSAIRLTNQPDEQDKRGNKTCALPVYYFLLLNF